MGFAYTAKIKMSAAMVFSYIKTMILFNFNTSILTGKSLWTKVQLLATVTMTASGKNGAMMLHKTFLDYSSWATWL